MKIIIAAALVSTAASAPAQTVPVTTAYATTVMKKGCVPVVFSANPMGAPAIAVGQAVDVVANGKQCSGYVAKVEHQLNLQRYATVEVRTYSTTVTLSDLPPVPPAP